MVYIPGSIERIEIDFPLFSSMEIREGWDTTPKSDSYIETVQICNSGLDQCWLKLCRTDSALARSLQADCRHSKSAHQPLHSLGQLGDCLCCTRMCMYVCMYIQECVS